MLPSNTPDCRAAARAKTVPARAAAVQRARRLPRDERVRATKAIRLSVAEPAMATDQAFPQSAMRAMAARVVLHQRLLVGEADGDFLHTGQPAQRALDGAGAQRAVQPADARPDARAVGAGGRLLAPELRCFRDRGMTHGVLLKAVRR
jgi:hypothetical protein